MVYTYSVVDNTKINVVRSDLYIIPIALYMQQSTLNYCLVSGTSTVIGMIALQVGSSFERRTFGARYSF